MRLMRTAAETTALSLLRRHGIAGIWQLEEAAAEAHQAGRDIAAALILEIADAAEVEWFRFAISRHGEASVHFTSVREGSLSTRSNERPIAPCPVILPGYQASRMAATGQQLAIVLLSWLVIFALIAALVAEALGIVEIKIVGTKKTVVWFDYGLGITDPTLANQHGTSGDIDYGDRAG